MKHITKIFALLLAVSMLLCGCVETKNPAEETKEEQTVASVAMTEEELAAALESGRATIGANLTLTKEVLVNNKILDGGNFTLTGPELQKQPKEGGDGSEMENVVETENGITVAGGTVENVTVIGKYRAIGDRKGMGANSDVRLKNVTVDGGDSYALNFGYGNGQASLFVDDSTLCGWSSYTKFQQAIFTNCTFGWSADGSNGTLRPYINTTLAGCHFEGKVNADGTVTPFNISFKSSTEGVTLILEDCYVGDTLITAENMNELLKVTAHSNIVQVRNTAA